MAETRKIVSASEAIARRLRSEMDERGGELSDRRRVAMEGLAVRPGRQGVWRGRIPRFTPTEFCAIDLSPDVGSAASMYTALDFYLRVLP